MRVKILVLAGSLGLLVAGLMFGTEMCVEVAKQQEQRAGAAEEGASEDDGVPNVTEGGVQNVNENLGKMKEKMQQRNDERQNDIDERLERSTGGSR